MIKFWSKFLIQILWYSFTIDNTSLLIPSQSTPGKQENPSSSVSRHNSFSVYFFLSSELSNGGIKVQVKLFLSPKKQQDSRQPLHEIFFNLQYKWVGVPISPTSKSTPRFSAAPSFLKNVSTYRSGPTKW